MAVSLDLDELQGLAVAGNYTGITALSNFSAVMLLSACRAFLHDLRYWTGASYRLTPAEADAIDELVSQAEYEIMSSAVGLILPHAGASIPAWSLLCDGASYDRVDYPELYAALDGVFIDDADTFHVPDLSDRFVRGIAPASASGDTGGAEQHTLSVAQLAAHSHSTVLHAHGYLAPVPGVTLEGAGAPFPTITATTPAVTDTSGVTVNDTGDGDPIDHLPPYLVLSHIIVSGA